MSQADQIAALSPVLGLALAKGDLPSALSLTHKLLTLPNSEDFQKNLGTLKPMLN